MTSEENELISRIEETFAEAHEERLAQWIRSAVDAFIERASYLNGIKREPYLSEGRAALESTRAAVLHACELDSRRDNPQSEQKRAELDAAVNVWLDELEAFLINTGSPDNPEDWPKEIQTYRGNIEMCGLTAVNLD